MTMWLRFDCDGRAGFGTLDGDFVDEHEGDLFGEPSWTGPAFRAVRRQDHAAASPSAPGLVEQRSCASRKTGTVNTLEEPLYLIKASSSYLAHGQTIETPPGYDGRVVYEGELGLVIGKVSRNLNLEEAEQAIFA